MVDVAKVPAGPKIREWSRKHGFDDWMVARWVKLLQGAPPGSLNKFLEGIRRKAPEYIRANPLRCSGTELERRLDARGFKLAPVELDPQMRRVVHAPISAGATQEHLLGLSTPQDVASGAAAMALGARPGDAVADLAAAPGIKSLHLAGAMKDEGTLVCVEPDEARMRGLRFNLERCGVTCAVTRQHTGQELPGEAWADRVLLDAPCTGEGTLPKDRSRRHGRPDEIARLGGVQNELMDAADRVLRPGGTMVYATCTFAPEENEAQVQRLLDRGYVMEPLPFDRLEAPLLPGLTSWPGLELDDSMHLARRFLPGIHPSLGLFIARLRKEAP